MGERKDMGDALQGRAATATQPSPQAVSGQTGIPIAGTAADFIYRIADIFQARHHGPLSRDRAVAEAVGALEAWEDAAPFGTPDYDWSLDGAASAAEEAMEHWEAVND